MKPGSIIVIVTTNSQRRRHKLRIAFDDIRLVPSSELLYELEQLELELAQDTPNETDIDPLAMDSSSSWCPNSKLQFAPPWIIEKAKQGSWKIVSRSSIPRSANIVSSRHFFSVK